jgi:predicted transcriptional regulator
MEGADQVSFFHRNRLDSIDDLKKVITAKALVGMPTGNQPIGYVSERRLVPESEKDKDCIIDVVSVRTSECFVVYCSKTEVVLFSQWADENRVTLVNGTNELVLPGRF